MVIRRVPQATAAAFLHPNRTIKCFTANGYSRQSEQSSKFVKSGGLRIASLAIAGTLLAACSRHEGLILCPISIPDDGLTLLIPEALRFPCKASNAIDALSEDGLSFAQSHSGATRALKAFDHRTRYMVAPSSCKGGLEA